jgi:adenylosuccinate lyase
MLTALSPLDGRYVAEMAPLRAVLSESALIHWRLKIECLYLEQLCRFLAVPLPGQFTHLLEDILSRPELVAAVKQREAQTRHDVKAVEYVLADALTAAGCEEHVRWIHWGLTSEDVNNLAWGCMLQAAWQQVLAPDWRELLRELGAFIASSAAMPMLARTHGQPASPTTVGKEYAVFASRLLQEMQHLETLLPPGGKLNGATGNWHVFETFFPDRDWQAFSRQFVVSLGLHWEPLTTQIVVRERQARIFDALRRMSNILIDAARDSWFYVSQGYFQLKLRNSTEVGSSTMPHKVNPVLFENAEGNLELACVLLDFMSSKLTRSRLQRDLSDSTVQRNLGVVLGHVHLGLLNFTRGLRQLVPRAEILNTELDQHWEVLAEPLQHALRLEGREIPYEQIRLATQGLQLTRSRFTQLQADLALALPVASPACYIGQARQLAEQTLAELTRFLALSHPET